MVAAGLLQHVRDELRGDGSAALVLLVLTGVGEQGDDRGNALRARDLAGVDHNAHLHERGVHLPAARVDDVHIVFPHRLCDVDVALANAALRDLGAAERDAKPAEEKGGRGEELEQPGNLGEVSCGERTVEQLSLRARGGLCLPTHPDARSSTQRCDP